MTQQASAEQRDGFLFKCSRCRRKKSLRKGSMLEGSRLTLAKILKIVYRYVEGVRVKRYAALVGVHRNTAMHWYEICHNVSTSALMSAVGQLGGKDIEVQADETMVARQKNNKGRERRQYWVVGMYDTSIRKAVFEHVNNRSGPALNTVITQWFAKESVVVTDEWKAYSRLPEEGYKHFTVNHSKNFVNPETGMHTNAIEAYWSRLKRKMSETGPTSGRAVWAHLDEAQYRLWYGLKCENLSQAWDTFVGHVANTYPLKTRDNAQVMKTAKKKYQNRN
uniref:Putative transposase-like protein HI_1328.1 n=1 Tax=Schistocephalus solidus TaxID=70667 RepID=A0A0X3QA71_SCHSO